MVNEEMMTNEEVEIFYQNIILPFLNKSSLTQKSNQDFKSEMSQLSEASLNRLWKRCLDGINKLPPEIDPDMYKTLANIFSEFPVPEICKIEYFTNLAIISVRKNTNEELQVALWGEFKNKSFLDYKKHLAKEAERYFDLGGDFKLFHGFIRFVGEEDRREMLPLIVKKKLQSSILAFDKTKIDTLKLLIPYFNDAFNTLTPDEIKKYAEINLVEDPGFIRDIMSEFRKGNEVAFGGITRIGGLLTIAETAKRKIYPVNPTILEVQELEEYLTILKNMTPPLRERFVMTGEHWICGDIKIDKNGQIEILIIDSMGGFNETWTGNTEKCFSTLAEIFPDAKIYYDDTQRQHSPKGCSVFALDDVLHLFTIERYLKEDHYEDLFDFLKKQNTSDLTARDGVKIIKTRMPAAFLRTSQTSNLYQAKGIKKPFLSDDIRLTTRLGKKQLTEEWVKGLSEHGFVDKTGAKTEKNVNVRLKEKLEKMANQNYDFLLRTPPEKAKEMMRNFSLNGFKERVSKTDAKVQEKTNTLILSQYSQAKENNQKNQEQKPENKDGVKIDRFP